METSPLPVKGCTSWHMLGTRVHWAVRVLQCAAHSAKLDFCLYWSYPWTGVTRRWDFCRERERQRPRERETERETQRDYRVIIVIMMLIRSRVFSKERERSVEGIHNCIPVSLLYTSRKILRGWTRIYLIQVMYFTHYSLHQIEVKTKSMAGSMLKWNKNDYEMRSSIWNWFGLISRTR